MKKMATLLLVLLTITLTGCGSKKNVNDPDRLQKQLDREMARVDEYKADVDKLEEENAELLAEIDSLVANNNTLNQKLDAVTEKSESSSSTDQQTITNLQKQVDDLKKQLVDTLQKQLAEQIALNSKNSSTATSSYLTIKFWSDGFTYTANVKWYCDPNCTKSAGDNITISSPVVSQDKLSNGYTVYTCMSTNGLVYSSQYPYLSKNK